MWLLVVVLALYLGFVYYNSIPSTSPSTSSAAKDKEIKKSSKKKKKKRSDPPVEPPTQPSTQPSTNNEPSTQQAEKNQGGSSDYSGKEEQVEQKPWNTTTFNNKARVNLAESDYPSLPTSSNSDTTSRDTTSRDATSRDANSDANREKEQGFTTIVKKIPLKTEEQWKTLPKRTTHTASTKAAPAALTKKQRENQRKKDRIKQAKEEEGEMQRQRLNSHRLAQIKAMYSN